MQNLRHRLASKDVGDAARRTAIGCTLALAAACVLFALEYPQPPRHLLVAPAAVTATVHERGEFDRTGDD